MGHATLHGIFERTAGFIPDAPALKAASQRISFGELNAWADEIAAAIIQQLKADPDRSTPIVGLLLPRGIEAIAGILGILKAGCAWLPLDPSYPDDRLRFMVEDSGTLLILTQHRIADETPFLGQTMVRILHIDAEPGIPAEVRAPSLTIGDASKPAYLIYTSGSTGRPKGVLGSHAAILSRFAWMWEAFPFEPGEVCCNKTALNFIDSIWEMLGGLLRGIPCVIADAATARDPVRFLHLLHDERVSRLVVVPSLLAALIEAGSATGISLDALRYVTSSGELLPSALAARVRELGDSIVLLNLYGSTEMAADATCCIVTDDVLDGKIAPIGRPIGKMRVVVLDERLRPVPDGTAGELCVSGPGLAIGYLGRPELTEKNFIANPFVDQGDSDHARLFLSGDIVAMRADGNLDYIGRRDFQIKIRGFRIEPGDVETTLSTHPEIDACAVGVVDHDDVRQLAAFYVTGSPENPDAAALRSFLLQRLPEYMVPSRFARLETLPLLPNGKLDRHALASLDVSGVDHSIALAETLSAAEAEMRDLWSRILRQSLIGLDDDFFAIGGDSLLAFRVATAARKKGWSLVPADIYANPTIRTLASHRARDAHASNGWHEVPSGGSVPLSPMQQYYFSWAKPNPNKFNVGFIAALRKMPQQEALAHALRALVNHHGALRLRFRKGPDGTVEQYHTSDGAALDVPICRMVLPQDGDTAQMAAMRAEIAQLHDRIDITSGPVMILALFEDPKGRNHHLFFTMHELVSDAWSLQIFLEDLRSAYTALVEGRAIALPERTIPYHRWVEKVRDYARLPETVNQLDYWLSGQSAQPFPEDFAERDALQSDIENHDFEVLDAEQMRSVRAHFGASTQSNMIHAVVAALAVTANRISGQSDLIFHKVAHGREAAIRDADPSRTIGWFITHTPITVRLPENGSDDLPSVLEHVAEQYQRIPDNGLGHSALRYFSDDPRAPLLAAQDQVRTLFQYIGDIWQENYDGELFLPPNAALMDLPDTVAAENCADYHLHVYAYLMDGCFRIKFFYTRPNYRRDTILRMERLFTEAVRGMLLHEGNQP